MAVDQDTIGAYEDALRSILRDSGYNRSFIVDKLKQKFKRKRRVTVAQIRVCVNKHFRGQDCTNRAMCLFMDRAFECF